MVLIDAVNDGINEGCDVHEDSNGGLNWFDWDTTLAPSNDNTYAATWATTHGHGTGIPRFTLLMWEHIKKRGKKKPPKLKLLISTKGEENRIEL